MSIQVSEQAISVALPSTSVKMLMVQPYLEFDTPLREPFPLLAECTTRLAQAIDTVFEIARIFDPHIMLFPEFGLPDVEAVTKVAAYGYRSCPILKDSHRRCSGFIQNRICRALRAAVFHERRS